MIKTDESRRWWQYLLPVTDAVRVLDIGAGKGSLSFPLAEMGYEVVAVDSDRKNIDFIEAKKSGDNVNNVETLCANILELPFPESSFDIIIMDGMAEQNVVNNMFGLLRKGGILCMATGNSMSLLRKKTGQRPYCLSKAGCQRMLREAGFRDLRFFLPLPGYDDCKIIIPSGEKNIARYCATHVWNKQRLRLLKAALPLIKILPVNALMDWFGPDYCIIATK